MVWMRQRRTAKDSGSIVDVAWPTDVDVDWPIELEGDNASSGVVQENVDLLDGAQREFLIEMLMQ